MASPFVQAPQDDDQPTGPAAVLLPAQTPQQAGYNLQGAGQTGVPQQAAQPSVQQPVDNTQVPWLPGQSPQQPQPAPVAQTAPPGPQATALPAASYPAIPAAPTFNQQAYQDLATKRTADANVDRSKYAPKWYDRLAGGLVGFGTGFKEGPTAGIAAGSKITDQRYDQALADSGRKVTADQQQMDDLTRQYGIQRNQYEDSLTGARLGTEQANDQRAQANSDREYQRETGRDAKTDDNTAFEHGYETTQQQEQRRRDDQQANAEQQRIAIERGQLGIAQSREKREAASAGSGTNPDGAPQPMSLNQLRQLDDKHDAAYRDEQSAYSKAKMANAGDTEALQQVEQAHQANLQNLQSEWNQRYAQAAPYGRDQYGVPLQSPPPGQPAAQQPQRRGQQPAAAPAPTQQPQQQPAPQQPGKPNLLAGGGKQLDATTAQKYLALAGGDKGKARQLAASDGWKF